MTLQFLLSPTQRSTFETFLYRARLQPYSPTVSRTFIGATLTGWLICTAFCFCTVTTPVLGADRLAFLIGIDKYDHLPSFRQLTRSVKDARAISATLEELGFQAETWENSSRSEFNTQWQDFLGKFQPDDTVVLFLSGHGIEIEGQNFLLPRDIPYVKFGRQEQLKRESISITELLLDLRTGRKPPRITVLIIDACRENPLIPPEYKGSAEGKGGLAKIEPPEGTFVMYSAAANETALDRLPNNDKSENSVYVRHLLPLMRKPDLPLPDLAQELRRQVRNLARTVDHVQRPAYYDGLLGRFCFAGYQADRSLTQTLILENNRLMFPDNAKRAWSWIKNTDSEDALVNFAAAFKGSLYADLAVRRVDLLKHRQGTLYVIVIGISDYESPDSVDLRFAAADALAVKEVIVEKMGPNYHRVEEYPLVDNQATRYGILEAFERVRRRSGPNDTIVVFLSGVAYPKEDQLYFMPFDSDPDRRLSTDLDFGSIQQNIGRMLGRRILLFDSTGLPRKTNLESIVLEGWRAEQIAVLMAAAPGQMALELVELGHGVFTNALIRGLSGKADIQSSGSIYFSELGQYVTHEVAQLTGGRQKPVYFLGERDFILTKD